MAHIPIDVASSAHRAPRGPAQSDGLLHQLSSSLFPAARGTSPCSSRCGGEREARHRHITARVRCRRCAPTCSTTRATDRSGRGRRPERALRPTRENGWRRVNTRGARREPYDPNARGATAGVEPPSGARAGEANLLARRARVTPPSPSVESPVKRH